MLAERLQMPRAEATPGVSPGRKPSVLLCSVSVSCGFHVAVSLGGDTSYPHPWNNGLSQSKPECIFGSLTFTSPSGGAVLWAGP